MRIFNGTCPLSCKISTTNIEILRINEDYVTTTVFALMLLNGLLVLVAPNFRNVKRRTECFFAEFLHVCEELRWHTVSLQKYINEIHLRAAVDRFLRSLPLNKPFSIISDLAFAKRPQKNGQHCRHIRAKKR